jgi:hypothetical protein
MTLNLDLSMYAHDTKADLQLASSDMLASANEVKQNSYAQMGAIRVNCRRRRHSPPDLHRDEPGADGHHSRDCDDQPPQLTGTREEGLEEATLALAYVGRAGHAERVTEQAAVPLEPARRVGWAVR